MRNSTIYVPLTALVLLLSACDTSGLDTDDSTASESAPLIENANRFIVVMKADAAVGKTARQLVDDYAALDGVQADYRYYNSIQGFAGEITPARLEQLRNDPNVAYIEKDQVVTINVQIVPTGIQRAFADSNTNLSIDGTDDLRVDVDIAILDTGIDREHPDLNVVGGVNCAKGGPFGGNCSESGGGDDDHYHGTHVAGAAATIDNDFGVVGVAPGARLWAVKVLNKRGSAYTSWIIGGIDWVTANAEVIEVANMSLSGSGFSQAEYDAIQAATNAGVAFVVAASNDDDDANNYSPASFDNTLTVSALADFDGLPGGGGPTNNPPTASFSFSCINLACSFDGSGSFDSEGSIASYDWEFGDGGSGSGSTTSNTFASDDTYLVTLTVTDDGGETGADTQSVSVTSGGQGGGINLFVVGYKVKGVKHGDLTWSGSAGGTVEVWRDGALITTIADNGAYTDVTGQKGGGSTTWQVCEAGNGTCSNTATHNW